MARVVDLASLLAAGPLVISFNRGPWCDYCGLELHALARAYPHIVAAGGDVVSIVPETAKYARVLQATRGLPFRVLTDLDLGYALSLGLAFWVGEKIRGMYKAFGIDLAQFQGNGGWLLPIPATLVVGRDGRVKARFVDPDFRHRLRMEEIRRAVQGALAPDPRLRGLGPAGHSRREHEDKGFPTKVLSTGNPWSRSKLRAIVNRGKNTCHLAQF